MNKRKLSLLHRRKIQKKANSYYLLRRGELHIKYMDNKKLEKLICKIHLAYAQKTIDGMAIALSKHLFDNKAVIFDIVDEDLNSIIQQIQPLYHLDLN